MKCNHILLAGVFFIAASSCSPNTREQAIIDYEEVKDGVRTDLKMKIISLEKKNEIHPSDSIHAITNHFFKRPLSADSARTYVANLEKRRAIADTLHRRYETLMGRGLNSNADSSRKYIHFAEANALEIELLDDEIEMGKFVLKRISEWEQQTGMLGTEWQCTYSITNPSLNNEKQEVTKIYFFSTENKIVSTRVEK